MTIEQLEQALNEITGKDPISVARRRAILSRLYALMNQK